MTQEEHRLWLIRYLQREMPETRDLAIPQEAAAQWHLLRALMNVRPPAPAPEEFLAVEGALLEQMTREKGIVDVEALAPSRLDERLTLYQGDITRLRVDAIVNAANSALLGCFTPNHSCIDNMIQTMAGIELRLACARLMAAQGHEEPPGRAKITPGFHLPARYVLHTVGPIVRGTLREKDRDLLAACYRACLSLAAAHGLRSVAFCCISTGVFHFPPEEAAPIAMQTVRRWLDAHADTTIRRVIFDVYEDSDRARYAALLSPGER